ncbi:MAG TPA: hypothetical protein VLM37_01315 [Fibrobacteraceae bacterium]|nr:hypothetical protein [Fibrobacteraceae bacterium]
MRFPHSWQFLYLLASTTMAGSWINLAAPEPIFDACATKSGIWLATEGGLRHLENNFESTQLTAADGLGETPQTAVVMGSDSLLYAVSEKGIVTQVTAKGKVNVLSRSYLEANDRVNKGLLFYRDGFLIIGFEERIAFFNITQKISSMTLTKIDQKSLTNSSLYDMVWHGDTLWVALDSSIYYRRIVVDSLSSDASLADPSTWVLAAHNNSGLIQSLWFFNDSLYWSSENGVIQQASSGTLDSVIAGYTGAVTLAGKSFVNSIFCPEDTCTPFWAARIDSNLVWLGDSTQIWKLENGTLSLVPSWDGLPSTNASTLALMQNGTLVAWNWPYLSMVNENGEFSKFVVYNSSPHYADYSSSQSTSQPLKTMAVDSADHILLFTWGGGIYTYGSEGDWLGYLNVDAGYCLDAWSAGMTIGRGMNRPEGAMGVVSSYWGQVGRNYGLAYVDSSLNVSCLMAVGTTISSGPLAVGVDSTNDQWWIFSAYSLSVGSASGGMDWFIMDNPDRTGSFSIASSSTISTGDLEYVLDVAWDPVHQRLWMISSSDLGWWEVGDTAASVVDQMKGFNGGDLTGLDLDAQGNPWISTRDKGVYKTVLVDESPDTLECTQYLPRNGLLSASVIDLAIDRKNGVVWFAHDLGISRLDAPEVRDGSQYQTDGSEDVVVYPNPFRPTVHSQVVFDHISEKCNLRIYDRAGHLVRSFQDDDLTGGYLAWDGKNAKGSLVAPGLYHWVAALGKKTRHGRLLIIY